MRVIAHPAAALPARCRHPARARTRRLVGLIVAVFCATAASTAGAAPPVARYAALGDSYTAGPMMPNAVGPLGCFRSDHNYPSLAAAMGAGVLHDASCSGATAQYAREQQGLNPPQFDVLTADTDVVTLQLGANDSRVVLAVTLCSTVAVALPIGTPCRDTYVTSTGDQLASAIAAAGPQLAAVMQGIHRRAPHARLLVLGYPAILPEADAACWPNVALTAGDVSYLRAKEVQLNAMISAQADGNNAEYVDLYTRSVGHDMCQAPGVRWVEGLVSSSSAYPFHPNQLGMLDAARAITATLARSAVPTPACSARQVTFSLRLRHGERLVRAAIYLDSSRAPTVIKRRRYAVLRIPGGVRNMVRTRARVIARSRTTRRYNVRHTYHRCAL